MSTFCGPYYPIVMEGLIFSVDPSNSACMQAEDTTCNDLIQGILCTGASGTPLSGAHTPNAANFPEWSSLYGGILDFAGGRGINVESDLGFPSNFTIEMWYYKNSSLSQYASDGRNDGAVPTYNFTNYSSFNLNYGASLKYNYSPTYNASDPLFLNQWLHIVLTSDDVAGKWYSNNVMVQNTGKQTTDLGINFRIGCRYTSTSQWTGYMGPINIYDKALTAEEVTYNFNAARKRFGL